MSGCGTCFFDDEHYRTGRYEMSAETVKACGYLVPKTPREELAGFLAQRGECWMQEKQYGEAAKSFVWAHEIESRQGHDTILLRQAMREWDKALRARLPAWGFPKLDIGIPAPYMRNMTREAEKDFVRMTIQEDVLNDTEMNATWWTPLRRNPGVAPPGLPKVLRVDSRWPTTKSYIEAPPPRSKSCSARTKAGSSASTRPGSLPAT